MEENLLHVVLSDRRSHRRWGGTTTAAAGDAGGFEEESRVDGIGAAFKRAASETPGNFIWEVAACDCDGVTGGRQADVVGPVEAI